MITERRCIWLNSDVNLPLILVEFLSSTAGKSMINRSFETSRFSHSVTNLLRRTRYSLARNGEQERAIFTLRYQANLREQAISPNPSGLLVDRFDELENCFNVGVFLNGGLAAALRLHLLHQKFPDSPLLSAFPDLVQPRLDAGLRIIDITRLATDFSIGRVERHLAYATVRLSMVAAEHFEADIILAAVRQEHIPFYRREFLAVQLSEPRDYPTLIKPLCLFEIDFRLSSKAIITRHSFYASTSSERAGLFGSGEWPVLQTSPDRLNLPLASGVVGADTP